MAILEKGWEMRDIKFDVHRRLLGLAPGEVLIDKFENVEDTKGNNGDKGMLRITNIRLIWFSNVSPRINLTIGYHAIRGFSNRIVTSKIRSGECESLYVSAKMPARDDRFEFIFTAVGNMMHKRLFNTLTSIHRAYETTRLYRELKFRGPLLNDEDELRLLPLEQILEQYKGVFNMKFDNGTLGTLVLTNIRILWHAHLDSLFNISLPYIQLAFCGVRNTQPHGLALVLETSKAAGDLRIGFRIAPNDRLAKVCEVLQKISDTANAKPVFGVQISKDRNPVLQMIFDQPLDIFDDDVEIEQTPARTDAFAAYFAMGRVPTEEPSEPIPPVFCEELGLAIEPLKPGFTISDLWNVHVD